MADPGDEPGTPAAPGSSAEPRKHDGPGDPAAYPPSWEADVVLRDGHTVRVRPILPGDAERLLRFHERQSAESVYFRFFSPRPQLSEREVRYFTNVDHHDRVAFVALLDDELVGVARYERYQGTDTAEVAFFVDDDHHGRGLATVLLEFLAAAGRHHGLTRFTASTLPNNRKMLAVFSAAGYEVSSQLADGVVDIAFDIHPTDESKALADLREQTAVAASVERLLAPRSVVVIGTGSPEGLGSQLLRSLTDGGYLGELHAVTPGGRPWVGLESVEHHGGVPEGVDLAVVALPAAEVPDVVEECGAVGVGAVVILSAGFAESGLDGAALQWQVVEAARRHGIRVLGPNCLGLVNTDPDLRLHATVAPGTPPAGRIGVMAESGTLAAAITDHAERTAMGISTFVAAGNPADVGPADLLNYWAVDEATDAVLLYLRSSGLPPRLVRAARAASLVKPVAVLGTILATGWERADDVDRSEIARRVQALANQTGVINVGTMEQLFDIGRMLSYQPAPLGSAVAVVGNSDGAVAIAADACRGAGLRVVELRDDNGRMLPNPLDLTYRATASDYAEALASVTSCAEVHSVLVVHAPPRLDASAEVVEAIVDASRSAPGVTFAATMLGAAGTPVIGDGHGVPVFRFPEHAARAIGRLAAYRQWRSTARAHGLQEPTGCDRDAAASVIADALDSDSGRGAVPLGLAAQETLMAAYGVAVADRLVAAGPEEAVSAAHHLGWPVALKGATRDRGNRTAASGVVSDLVDDAAVRSAWDRMAEAHGDAMHPVVVQRFIARGVDAAIRLRRSPMGSATVEVGLGGPVSSFDRPQLGVLPLSLADAQSLVATSALGRALSDPLDRVALVGVVHRLAALFDHHEELVAIDADPVVASVEGAYVADVRVEVRPVDDELEVRRLD